MFLFDEPLSNLDAKLRVAMRTEITKLHQRLQTTFIYVTHDQTEAMTCLLYTSESPLAARSAFSKFHAFCSCTDSPSVV